MATYDIVYDYGVGVPVVTVTGNQKDVIKRAKEYVAYNYPHVRRFTIYHSNSTRSIGHWVKKGSRWYTEQV